MSLCSQCGAPFETVPEAFDFAVKPCTRHRNLLTTNEPPEDSDTVFIQSIVSKCDARLAYLEDKISNSTDRREEFEEERLSLLACRVQNRAILSPVRRIPTEILGDIFWWTLPSVRDLERSGFDFRNSPWLLTHISSRWRAISIATSSLWSCIVIDYSEIRHKGPRGPSSEHHLSLVEAQIQRSRAQQLQVHFYACLEMNSRAQIQMFELLSRHSSRWEGLSLGLSSKIFPSLATLRGRLPSLKRLWVQWDDSETNSVESLLDCFQTASSLVDVGVFNEYRHVPMCLPAPQLTRYGLTGSWSIHECILQGAPNLVEAHIGCVFDLELWSGSLIELQRLQRLYISDWLILSVLKAPALQELAVSLYPDEGPRYLNCLRDFVNRSLCSLRRICHRKSPEAHTIIEILKSFPSLTELVLITHYPVSEVISALRLTGSTVVAPQLQTLFFGCEVDATIDYTAYLDMLKACWEAKDCALQHAALITCGKPPLEPLTFIGLLALRQAGLDLVLSENESESFGFIKAWLYGTTWN